MSDTDLLSQTQQKEAATVTEVALSEVEQSPASNAARVVDVRDMSLIQDLPVTLTAVIGDVTLTVKDLYSMTVGQVVAMNTLVAQPIQLMFDKQPIAQGMLVAVDDHYGIEITALADIKV